jgi:class 3 adenylate cyclase/tetratricopeptide (TPR) repeat protein
MRCPRCQHENPTGTKFCGECAAPLASTCPSCGATNAPGNKFCGQCTAPLRTAPTAKFIAPESYIPKHLAEKILTSRAALEGERKQVTVLFADLKGSMELLADRDPEEARKLLDPVLEHMMEAVHRYEGTVNQVMGDGIMALFGAPLAHEDHAVRACYAALRMQEAVRRYADETRRAHGVSVQIRVGLNSGGVVVWAIGSDLHMDYTAVGQTTHLAARMEQLAHPGSILLTPATLELVEGYVEVRSLGPVPVKGLGDPVEVYEVTGAGAVRTRLQASARRGLSRFVGRDGEIDQLRRALERARDGHGQVVAVVGEAGVGKSRLFHEFTRSHRVSGEKGAWLVLEAGSVSYGRAASYLPVIDLLKAYFRIQDRDEHREVREKVTGKLLTLDRRMEPILPALLALLDVPTEDPEWPTLEPPQRRQRTLDAVKRLLLRESQVQPLLLVFEDLHWIDTETQGVLDSLVESLPTARILLLVNHRPEYEHPWPSKSYHAQLRLDALPSESVEELLRALVGDDPALGPLKHALAARTSGNPLFLEESVRALVETKGLVGERGAYRAGGPLEAIQVPATVQAILASRIDRLPAEGKRLLQAAAVVGNDVPFLLLHAVTGESEEDLRRGLARLQAAEFLYETALFPDLEYTFKHALTHEVAYAGLLHDSRRTLHARIVPAIERLYAERLTEQVERLAHHALRAEAWDLAVRYLRQSGGRALARSANREAAQLYEQALAALDHLADDRDRRIAAMEIRGELRAALVPLHEFERILEILGPLEADAVLLDEPSWLGRASVWRGECWRVSGSHDRAIESGERGLAIALSRQDDTALLRDASFHLGLTNLALGRYPETVACFRRVTRLDDQVGMSAPGFVSVPNGMGWLAWSLALLGDFDEGLAVAREAFRRSEVSQRPLPMTTACAGLGGVHLLRGDLGAARGPLERGVSIAREHGVALSFGWLASSLGYVHALGGRPDAGVALAEEALAHSIAIGRIAHRSRQHRLLAECHLLAGHIGPAGAAIRDALDLARRHGERGNEAEALRVLGEVTAGVDGDMAEAAAYFLEALALAQTLHTRPLAAHCHLGVGKLYRRLGKRQEAQEHLATAAARYREMEMRFWLEQVEAETNERV